MLGSSGGYPLRSETANDVFKRAWSARVAWCTTLATGLHAAAFVGLPAWQRATSSPTVDQGFEDRPITLLTLGDGADGSRRESGGADAVSAPALPTRDGDGTEAGPTGDLSSPSLAALWDRIGADDGLLATLVEPDPQLEIAARPVSTDSADVEDIRRGTASTSGLTLDPEPGDMDLESLSAIRPELALMDPSSWVLVRNPLEVDRFMRRTYALGELGPDESGLVSVALWIDERGTVQWAEIDRSSGRAHIDEVALELFREVIDFRPARDEGVPVSRSAIFSVRFPWYVEPGDDRPRRR